jgi:tetratricopeptide (TPR) repeat protein
VALIGLDRPDEAADILRPLAASSPAVALLLAAVYRDTEQWSESDALYHSALDRLSPRAATDPSAREGCRMARAGLAFNARAEGRPADAERALLRGLVEVPAAAAHFHFLLGKHYHDGGRPDTAGEHLREAVRLDPAKYRAPADADIRQIRTTTHGCLIRGLF